MHLEQRLIRIHCTVHVEKVLALYQIDQMEIALDKQHGHAAIEQSHVTWHLVKLDRTYEFASERRCSLDTPYFELLARFRQCEHVESIEEDHFGEGHLFFEIAAAFERVCGGFNSFLMQIIN